MVKGTMFSGESKNIESKVSLPDKSEKYVKTIVAFANTQGGKLIVGVDDKNHQVIGVENDILFQTMDAIATAVSDSCMPQIIPDIEPQTVEGKTNYSICRGWKKSTILSEIKGKRKWYLYTCSRDIQTGISRKDKRTGNGGC